MSKDEIKINEEESSLAEFTKRSLPNEREMENFEKAVEKEYEKTDGRYEYFDTDIKTEQDEEMEESLNEIYNDSKGGKVDVKSLDKVKRHGLIFRFFTFVFTLGIIGTVGYGAYYYISKQFGTDVTSVDFNIQAKTEIISGEEFFYTVNYQNTSNVNFKNANIDINFPENFVFLDSSMKSKDDNKKTWEIGNINAHAGGELKIKGMLVGPEEKNSIIVANLVYNPEGFSSEFKKEASLTSVINQIGLNINFDYSESSLVGEANEISIKFSKQDNNFINNYRVTLEPQDNIQFLNEEVNKDNAGKYSIVRPGVWQVDEVTNEEQILPIKFKFSEKKEPIQIVKLLFEQQAGQDKYYTFLEKDINYEVMKNDLNLTLIINGSREDQGVDFGQTLNYSIVYKNKGEAEMKDVVIMAVLESEFLDRSSLEDEKKGREKGNSITWTKEEIPELASVAQNQEGMIDFSIKVIDFNQANINSGKEFQVKSYGQFSVGKVGEEEKNTDSANNKSNTIINQINSDLRLDEQARYFDEDNITVGNGPLPFQVGQKTSIKIYWTLTNNLHELTNAKVETFLPGNVAWDGKSRTNVGTVDYDKNSNKVTWNIGRLPISVFRADAEFNIAVIPSSGDQNKIMVIKPGSEVTATDSVTGTLLKKNTEAKTTKLEDDDIAEQTNDGIVR